MFVKSDITRPTVRRKPAVNRVLREHIQTCAAVRHVKAVPAENARVRGQEIHVTEVLLGTEGFVFAKPDIIRQREREIPVPRVLRERTQIREEANLVRRAKSGTQAGTAPPIVIHAVILESGGIERVYLRPYVVRVRKLPLKTEHVWKQSAPRQESVLRQYVIKAIKKITENAKK